MKMMIMRVSVVAGLTFVALGCAGLAGGSFENQAACKQWVNGQNEMKCMKDVQMDADQICPDSLDMTPLDMTGYYKCMKKSGKCNGKIPDLAAQGECKPPSM